MEVLREEPEQWKGPIGLRDPVSERWIMWGPKGLWGSLVYCSLNTHRYTHILA